MKENITYCVLEARRIGICSKCGKGLCASLFVGFLNSGLAGKTLKSSHHDRYLKLIISCSCLFLFVKPLLAGESLVCENRAFSFLELVKPYIRNKNKTKTQCYG